MTAPESLNLKYYHGSRLWSAVKIGFSEAFQRYSKRYSRNNFNQLFVIKINNMHGLFRLPRPTKSKKEDVLGRLFLCLDFDVLDTAPAQAKAS